MYISRRALKGKKYLFRDIHNFSFSAKIQDGRQKWRKLKFSPRHRILLYYPAGQKFARNRSISYHFKDIFKVLFSAKIQDGCQKWRELKFSPLCIGYSCITLWVKKFTRNCSISYGFRDIHTFSFSVKIQDGLQKWRKLKFFPFV